MNRNFVIEILNKVIDEDIVSFFSGEIINIGKEECSLSNPRGSVYGILVEIKDQISKQTIFNNIESSRRKIDKLNEWKKIDDSDYYPLYWGKDINMGVRLHAHTKTMKSTGTLQLNTIKVLENHKVIYGVVPCLNYEQNEKKLISKYPSLLKTIKGQNDSISITELVPDEEN